MNTNKLTQKSAEAIGSAQSLAVTYGNTQIDQEHLLCALLSQEGGFLPRVLTSAGVDAEALGSAALALVEKLPRVSGPGRESGKVYVSQEVDRAFNQAEREADRLGDEYVSVEHLLLALLQSPNAALKSLFGSFGVDTGKYLQALAAVRGNTRVTSDNPEATYDALKKYGFDLVERARQNKLDPVI
ncbi:MAG: Clp protease N-terminal domain-containing protein, partial [Oscillospiraceae bacterium]